MIVHAFIIVDTYAVCKVPYLFKLLIPIHSLSVAGALTYWWCKAVQIASQVSPTMEQTVDRPKRKLKDSDTYYSGHII